jgi:hypothetical protein
MMTHKIFIWVATSAVLLVGGLAGCIVGPASIAVGRGVYNEVINRTEDEQLLNMIVHERYNETYGMLAVASVTANISASADVHAEFGLSRTLKKDYDGNLVPLAGGVAFEEKPTIAYTPLGGEAFVQRLLSPLSLEEILLMSQYLPRERNVYSMVTLNSINGIPNPLVTEHDTGSATFDRVVSLWLQLERVGVLRFARDPSGELKVVIRVVDTEHEKALEELLKLTGISKRPSGGQLVLPVRTAQEVATEAFTFESRSVLAILRTAGDCIEIPESHLRTGVLEPGVDKHEGRFMRICTSRFRPGGHGTIAIQYRGWWYYVDDSDPASKQAFAFLRTLVGLRLYKQGLDQAAPVLTIPVG